MAYIRGVDRNEVLLFPECVEDYITEDNPVRFIDAFVESLDLAELGFVRSTPVDTSRCRSNFPEPVPSNTGIILPFSYEQLHRVTLKAISKFASDQFTLKAFASWSPGFALKPWVSKPLRIQRNSERVAPLRPRFVTPDATPSELR